MPVMRICHVTPELSPLAKVGGLADVCGALPSALASMGHQVRVVFPLYSSIDVERHGLRPWVEGLRMEQGAHKYSYDVWRALGPGGVDWLGLRCDALYARDGLYTDHDDEHRRFALLTRAALEICQRLQWGPHVFHGHDWQTGLLPLYLQHTYAWDRLFSGSRSLITVHNLGYQGTFPTPALDDLALPADVIDAQSRQKGFVSFLKEGLLHADRVSTVSPTYAQEIQTNEMGFGMDGILRARTDEVRGILNGVDTRVWDPENDPLIPFHYSARSPWRKRKNKEALLTELQMELRLDTPLVGLITRLAWQKGLDLVDAPLREALSDGRLQVVVLGTGEERFEAQFHRMRERFPGQVGFHRGFSEELAHLIEAGSDFFLMPSRYEPCGLNQMYSQIYGTIPLVRRTGGLADSVQPLDGQGGGTGILFDHINEDAVRWALDAAVRAYHDTDTFKQVVANAMAQDFSWDARARDYVELYSGLAASVGA